MFYHYYVHVFNLYNFTGLKVFFKLIQVLSAINLVLAECKINVILGIDKKMIQRAVERHFEDNDDRDLADKFICKIIQIPLSLPDLVVEESDKFLQRHLGHPAPTKSIIRVDDEDTDYGEIDTDNDGITRKCFFKTRIYRFEML